MLSKAEEIGLILMIFVLMLGIGSSLTLADFKNAWRKPRGILIGMVSQFGLMPLIGFSLASLLGLPEWVGISLILVACTPGGTTSNLFTYFSRGDVSLSISMTVASSLAAIVMMPLLVGFYVGSLNSEIVVPAGKIIASVGIMLIPVSIGLLVRGKHPKTAAKLEKAGGLAGILIIALLIGSFVARESSRLAATPVHVYLAVLGICTGGFFFGYVASRTCKLSKRIARTISLETGIQNTPLTMAVILTSFPESVHAEMMVLPLIYAVCIVLISCLVTLLYRQLSTNSPNENQHHL